MTLRQICAPWISAELHTFWFSWLFPLLDMLINMQSCAGRTVHRIQWKGSTYKGHCCCTWGERFDCLMHKLSTHLLGLSEAIAYQHTHLASVGDQKQKSHVCRHLDYVFCFWLFHVALWCCEFLTLIAILPMPPLAPWALAAVSGIPTLVGNVAVHGFLILKWPGSSAMFAVDFWRKE